MSRRSQQQNKVPTIKEIFEALETIDPSKQNKTFALSKQIKKYVDVFGGAVFSHYHPNNYNSLHMIQLLILSLLGSHEDLSVVNYRMDTLTQALSNSNESLIFLAAVRWVADYKDALNFSYIKQKCLDKLRNFDGEVVTQEHLARNGTSAPDDLSPLRGIVPALFSQEGMKKDALVLALQAKSRLENRVPVLFELLDQLQLKKMGPVLSSENSLQKTNGDILKDSYQQIFRMVFEAIASEIRSSKTFGVDIFQAIMKLVDTSSDIQTLTCLIDAFEELFSDAYYSSDWHKYLSQCLANLSLKASKLFVETASPKDNFKILKIIATGMLRGERLDDLQSVMGRLETVFKRLPSEPAQEREEAALFLGRCQVVLHEKNDDVFFEKLKKYFTYLPLPGMYSEFALLLIPRLSHIYFNAELSPEQRLLAREVYTIFIIKGAAYAAFTPMEHQGKFSKEFVSISDCLTTLEKIASSKDSPSPDEQRQRALPPLRIMTEVKRHYRRYFSDVMKKKDIERGQEDYQIWMVPVFFDVVDFKMDYSDQLSDCANNVNLEKGYAQYAIYSEAGALLDAQNLKALSVLLNKIEKNTAYGKDESDAYRIITGSSVVKSYFKEGSAFNQDSSKTAENNNLLIGIFKQSKIYKFFKPYTPEIFKMAEVEDLDPSIKKTAMAISGLLIKVALMFCSPKRFTLSSKLEDFNTRSREAYEFLTNPFVFERLTQPQQRQVISVLSDDIGSSAGLISQYKKQASQGENDGKNCYLLDSRLLTLLNKTEYGIEGQFYSIDHWIGTFDEAINEIDCIFKKVEFLRPLNVSDFGYIWNSQEKGDQLGRLKNIRDQLAGKRDMLQKVCKMYDKYVQPLIAYIQIALDQFPKSKNKSVVQLETIQVKLKNKDAFIRDNLDDLLTLASGSPLKTPKSFINELLDVKNSSSLREELSAVIRLSEQKHRSVHLFGPKPEALQPLEQFINDENYPSSALSRMNFSNMRSYRDDLFSGPSAQTSEKGSGETSGSQQTNVQYNSTQ